MRTTPNPESLQYLRVILCDVNRRIAKPVLRKDIGLAFDEQPYGTCVAVLGSVVQRRIAILGLEVDLCSQLRTRTRKKF